MMIFASKKEGGIEFTSLDFTFSMVNTMVKATFIIFASVLIARFIIEEYKSNTITVLFMYPINRKKLIIAKVAYCGIIYFYIYSFIKYFYRFCFMHY